MSVFISWAGADRDVKNVIAAKLREEKIEYYDSDEFCKTDFSKECIENIRRSSIFIVIISDASMDQRSYVFNEVLEARRLEGEGLLNILVYKVTENPYTERFAFNLNHISDANHVARIQKKSGVSGIECLIKRTKALLARRLEGNPEKPYDVNVPKLSGVRVSQTKFFVEGSRDSILEQLENAFKSSNVVILSELFGFGKKSAIKKYIQLHPEFNAVEIQGMHDSLFRFFLTDLHFSNINDSVFDKSEDKQVILKKFEFLKKLTEHDMIVVSDINLDGDADEFICALLSELSCKIVFITQDTAADYADAFPVITVGKMKNEHLFELFFHYYKCAGDQEKELLIPHLERFFDDIGGHTKAVELTASVLYKELRATPEEVISHLSVGSDDNKGLKDKIFDVFSELLSLGRFDAIERKILFLISLMANPTIDERTLLSMMDGMSPLYRFAITSLDEHRWITYDARAKTIYVEPIIAQISANRFLSQEGDVCERCLDYFKNTSTSIISRIVEHSAFFARVENFFNMLNLDATAGVVKVFRNQLAAQVNDFDEIRLAKECFQNRYKNIDFSEEPEISEINDFETAAARWVYSIFYLALRIVEVSPAIYTFANNSCVSLEELRNLIIDKDLEEIINDEIGNGAFSELMSTLEACSDPDDVIYIGCLLCISVIYAFFKKDFVSMQNSLDELLNLLQDSPQAFEDPTLCNSFLLLLSALHHAYITDNAVGVGIALYEKLLLIDLPVDIKYRLLILYTDALFAQNNEAELALSVMEAAAEIFDEAMSARNASESEYLNAKQELMIYHSFALAHAGEVDAAIEKYNEIKDINGSSYSNLLANLTDLIAEHLISTDSAKALKFLSENRDFISNYIKKDGASASIAESFEALLLLQELYECNNETGFSSGGTYIDESYYQKYSRDKKNNLFVMMSYDRITNKIKRYDFSKYTNEELAEYSRGLYRRASENENKMNIIPEAFALVSEAGFRVLGYRHHKVQYTGAIAMLDGKLAEILNGEGKTYTIALVAYVNSLYSPKTVVVDNSQYLTQRNYKWMAGIYELLGAEVGYMSSKNDRDLLSESSTVKIIYTDLASLGFSILYNEQSASEKLLDFSKYCAIVDEADSTLIESANLPIRFTGTPSHNSDHAEMCLKAYTLACSIRDNAQYYSVNKHGKVLLNREIQSLIEAEFDVSYENLAQANQIKILENTVELALYSFTMFKNKDFFVKNGKIYKENLATGSLQEVDNQLGYFLSLMHRLPAHQYRNNICQKQSIYNTTHVYSVLKRFGTLCGTSATVCSFKKEFKDIYNLDVVAIPTVLPIKRVDQTVGVFVTRRDKNDSILNLISEKYQYQQPIVLIVESIKESVEFSTMLNKLGIKHTLLNALNSEKSPEVFANAGTYGSVVIATQLANRGIDIKLGGDAERMTIFNLVESGIDVSGIDQIAYRLPSDEIKSSELYRKYSALLEKNKAIVSFNKNKVIEAGGLCVISTTMYFDMRTEQQIRGRAGRQGEVGESYVFISMEDDLMVKALGKLLKSRLLQNMVKGVPIIDSHIMKRSIEFFKNQVHHDTFAKMRNATDLSIRKDKSKNEIFKLKYGISDETVTFDDLIKIWCKNDVNIKSAQEIANGNIRNATPSMLFLWKRYTELFADLNSQNISEKLFEIAGLHVSETPLSKSYKILLFIFELSNALSLHLTEMDDAETMYGSMNIKNSNTYFDDLYSKNLTNHISDAIDRWLIKLEKRRYKKSAE